MALQFSAPCAFALAVAVLPALAACDDNPARTPTTPSTTPSVSGQPTRIIRVATALDFGAVEVGPDHFRTVDVCNDGTTPLVAHGMNLPEGFWVPGQWDFWEPEVTISPGACVPVEVAFTPTSFEQYSGNAFVLANNSGGNNAFRISGTGSPPSTVRTSFGDGRYLIGAGVAPGRYYGDPSDECYVIRTDSYPPDPDKLVVFVHVWADPAQWIVDIPPSDGAFESRGCGTWSQVPPASPAAGVIEPGVWEVRTQVPQGRYRATAGAGCTWQRLRDFEGTSSGIIEEGSTQGPAEIDVSIRSSDVGFLAGEACGTWRRVS